MLPKAIMIARNAEPSWSTRADARFAAVAATQNADEACFVSLLTHPMRHTKGVDSPEGESTPFAHGRTGPSIFFCDCLSGFRDFFHDILQAFFHFCFCLFGTFMQLVRH